MTSTRTLARSFAAGEITPELFGRLDLTTFQTGLAKCQNMITLPHGPAMNRPGTEFVREVKTSSKKTRLIPFQFSTTQTTVLEFGDQYIRFHTDGGTILSGGSPYEISTPYLEADLFDLHYTQSADVLTIVHPNYAPRELRRSAATSWALTAISFSPQQDPAGTGVTATAFDPNFPPFMAGPNFIVVTPAAAGTDNVAYRITSIYNDDFRSETSGTLITQTSLDAAQNINLKWGAVGGASRYCIYRSSNGLSSGTFQLIAETTGLELDDNRIHANTNIEIGDRATDGSTQEFYVVTLVSASGDESVASSEVQAINILTNPGAANIINVTATTPRASINVYKKRSGLYGFIGTTTASSFTDNNIEPDLSRQPPNVQNPFSGTNNFPRAVDYFEQRRLFAGTNNLPQNLWGTATGTESSLLAQLPPRDADAFSFRIAARRVNTIRHIVPLTDVILLTNSAEWRFSSSDGGAITPNSLSVRPMSYVGASNVQPVVTSNSLLYAQARGGRLREIIYSLNDQAVAGYQNSDASIMAPHLFDYKTITDLAFSAAPYPILWSVSSDGKLLGLTYVPDQKVAGWHQHVTDGTFESCCVVAEGDEDRLYVVVRRTINGVNKRYVERLHTRSFSALEDAFFVDCGLTYTGAAATTISGLGHLEGKTVSVLGNGATFPPKVVTSGSITLEQPVTKAHIGLPITAELRTLPMTIDQMTAFGQGRGKNVNKVFLKVYKSSIVAAGPDTNHLKEYKQRIVEPFDSPPALIGGDDGDEIEIPLTPKWGKGGQVVVRQSWPLPLTVLSMALDVAIGG